MQPRSDLGIQSAMFYAELQRLSTGEFKRLCGVSRESFSDMVAVLRPYLGRQGQRGRHNKLRVEDQLLVALDYWREVGGCTKPRWDASSGKLRTSWSSAVSCVYLTGGNSTNRHGDGKCWWW